MTRAPLRAQTLAKIFPVPDVQPVTATVFPVIWGRPSTKSSKIWLWRVQSESPMLKLPKKKEVDFVCEKAAWANLCCRNQKDWRTPLNSSIYIRPTSSQTLLNRFPSLFHFCFSISIVSASKSLGSRPNHVINQVRCLTSWKPSGQRNSSMVFAFDQKPQQANMCVCVHTYNLEMNIPKTSWVSHLKIWVSSEIWAISAAWVKVHSTQQHAVVMDQPSTRDTFKVWGLVWYVSMWWTTPSSPSRVNCAYNASWSWSI